MAAAAVKEALSSQALFVFGHLLSEPAVKALEMENPEYFRLLRVFAYGTLADLTERDVAALSVEHLAKLRILSIVQLASRRRILSYQDLKTTLRLNSVRELEAIVIEAVYKGLLSARLDSKRGLIIVEDWAARDVTDDVHSIASHIAQWLEAERAAIAAAKHHVELTANELAESRAQAETVAAEVARLKAKADEDASKKTKKKGGRVPKAIGK